MQRPVESAIFCAFTHARGSVVTFDLTYLSEECNIEKQNGVSAEGLEEERDLQVRGAMDRVRH